MRLLIAGIMLTAAADPGTRAFQKCYACHAIEAGKNDLTGPSLNGIIGRPVASVAGFEYSPAMRAFAKANPRWTRDLIDRFVTNPDALVPGTAMGFNGVRDADERAALLAYLARSGE